MTQDPVYLSFIAVAAAIVIDTILGAVKAAIKPKETFDIRELPRFLANGILPYVGSLGVLAAAAVFVGAEFEILFFAAAAATTAKYLFEIKDKLTGLIGTEITTKK